MLHAAAMLSGLVLVWFALVGPGSPMLEGAAIAGACALACVILAWRFGGVGAGFTRAPSLGLLSAAGVLSVARGALTTLRAVLAADVTLRPALVRVKTRIAGLGARAAFAEMLSAAPGVVAVETDSEGVLIHVNDEDSVATAALGRLEADIQRAVGAGS